jgi:leucyl/phenylalanyl-tRNA--protein transferase
VPVRLLTEDTPLPPPEDADPRGLVAVGGDLRPERLLDAYRRGIFPWYEEGLPILWHSPDPRMVLRATELRVSKSLRKRLRAARYAITLDTAFDRVIARCATVPREGQAGTWITDEMQEAYRTLHRLGVAHSAEAWEHGELVGGLYGVGIGAIFCGESMFALAPDASKCAFVWLVRQLQAWGVDVVDCQVHTEHLASLGATEWPRRDFLAALAARVDRPGRAGRWSFDAGFRWDAGAG